MPSIIPTDGRRVEAIRLPEPGPAALHTTPCIRLGDFLPQTIADDLHAELDGPSACARTPVGNLARDYVESLFGVKSPSARSVLIVSPHLDDAVLSIGATIACLVSQGVAVEVLTLFAGQPVGDLSPVARHFHDLCEHTHNSSAIRARRKEDQVAMEALGAQWTHSDFLDAVYRRTRDGQWLCIEDLAMFADDLADESYLVEELSKHISLSVNHLAPDLLFTSAANGGHVDHSHTLRATRATAEGFGLRMLAWEDLPYAIGTEPMTPQEAAEQVCLPLHERHWISKLNAVDAYASQVRMLWPAGDWATELTTHATSRGAGTPVELLWTIETARDLILFPRPASPGAS